MISQAVKHVIHSTRVTAPKTLNQFERQSIADRHLIHGTPRRTLQIEYGVERAVIDEIMDEARFLAGIRVGENRRRFLPPMGHTNHVNAVSAGAVSFADGARC